MYHKHYKEREMFQATASDIATCEGSRWLNDTVLDNYGRYLYVHKYKSPPRVTVASSSFYSTLADPNKKRSLPWKKGKADTIYFIANQDYHWVVVRMRLKDKIVDVYDSFCSNLNKIKETLIKADVTLESWTFQYGYNRIVQTNGYDCGVYACMFLDLLLSGRPLRLIESMDTKEMRLDIAYINSCYHSYIKDDKK